MKGDPMSTEIFCQSSHGCAGYAAGYYWDGDVIVCGFCGYCGVRIKNPPTFSLDAKGQPKWPGFIRGTKGVRYDV